MDLSKEIQQVITVLSKEFGSTGQHLWELLVRQQYVECATDFGIWAILLTITILMVRTVKKGALKPEGFLYDNDLEGLFVVTAVIVGIALLFVSCCLVFDAAVLINPEYYAIKDILELIPIP